MKRIINITFILLVLFGCSGNFENLKGTWIDESGASFTIGTSGTDRLVLSGTGNNYLLFPGVVLQRSSEDDNVYIKKGDYSSNVSMDYRIEVINEKEIKLSRKSYNVITHDYRSPDGRDINLMLTRMN